MFTKISINVTTEEGEVVSSLALEQTDSRPTGQAMTHEDKLDVVRHQFDLRSDFGDISRVELKQHVADELNTSQRNANRFIKDLIDRKVFKVDGRSIVTGDNYDKIAFRTEQNSLSPNSRTVKIFVPEFVLKNPEEIQRVKKVWDKARTGWV